MSRIQVTRENIVCAICGKNHYRSTDCEFYGIARIPMYKSRCSRCNQHGHNRANRQKCSLYVEYPNYNYLRNSNNVDVRRSNTTDSPRSVARRSSSPRPQPETVVHHHHPVVDEEVINGGIAAQRQTRLQFRQDMLNTIIKVKTLLLQVILNTNNTILIDRCIHFRSRILTIEEKIYELNDTELIIQATYINDVTRYLLYIINPPKRELELIKIVYDFYEPPSECCICITDTDYNSFCELNCKHKVCVSCMFSLIKSNKYSINKPINCPLCRCNITSLSCYEDKDIIKIDSSL